MPHVSPQPSRPVRVLFVCLGNICRSPSAEGLFRHYVASQAPKETTRSTPQASSLTTKASSPTGVCVPTPPVGATPSRVAHAPSPTRTSSTSTISSVWTKRIALASWSWHPPRAGTQGQPPPRVERAQPTRPRPRPLLRWGGRLRARPRPLGDLPARPIRKDPPHRIGGAGLQSEKRRTTSW